MSLIYMINPQTNQAEPVNADNPLPTIDLSGIQAPVAGRTITRLVQIPGIGTGSAYQALDAFGTLITFPNVFRPEVCSGVIVAAFFIDMDDEGIGKNVIVFSKPVAGVADNAAWAPSDADMLSCRGAFSIASFVDCNTSQVATATGINLWVNSTDQNLYCQVLTVGADNVAAGNIPQLGLVILPD